MKATHLKLYSLKLSFENKLYFLSTEINTCLLSNIGMNHQHRPKCYTEYISLLTISSVNKQEYRWLTDAICREQTLIQIYKCKCTVSWHRMSNHTSGKQLWESKIFLSVGVTKIPPPPQCSAYWTSSYCKIKETELCFLCRVQVSTKLWKSPLRWVTDMT